MSDHGFSISQIGFIKQLITNRNKEVRHEVSDHLDNTLPYKKIAGLGGSTPEDGCVITSDTSQAGGVKWANPQRRRRSLGMAPIPTAAGDYVMAYGSSGITLSPYWVPVTGNYPQTGMMQLSGLDLLAGSTDWRIRTFYNIAAGDSRAMYTSIIAANDTGAYGNSGNAAVSGSSGIYPEGTDTGTASNPRTVGGSGNRTYSFVGPWVTRATLVASGYESFSAYAGFVATVTSIGWFGEGGLEIELL